MSGAEKPQITIESIDRYLTDVYIPLANTEREVAWPTDPNVANLDSPVRMENVAEHSLVLSQLAIEVGGARGLNIGEIALYAPHHDTQESVDGDVSVMDVEAHKTKHLQEEAAIAHLEITFPEFPIMNSVLKSYELQDTPEKILVKSLDKLVATMMIMKAGGRTWKARGHTFDSYRTFAYENIRPKIKDEQVLGWYDQLFESLEAHQEHYFIPAGTVVGVDFSPEQRLAEIPAA